MNVINIIVLIIIMTKFILVNIIISIIIMADYYTFNFLFLAHFNDSDQHE